MKCLLNFLVLLLFTLPIKSNATIHEKIITDCSDITNVCIGDTIRYIGDSLNSNAYGVTYISIFNSISQNNTYYTVTSNIGVATTQDHVIINGDESFELQLCGITTLYFVYNCPLNIESISNHSYRNQVNPNPTTGIFSIGYQKQNIELFSIDGKKLFEVYDNKMDITNFNSGFYLIITKDIFGEIISRDKIIKE
ncbi:MAG: hypothetical protein H6589_10405 [Flavobacteriales bacterium]|nr:hypothetical protein [Flavobacteriales bacterium]